MEVLQKVSAIPYSVSLLVNHKYEYGMSLPTDNSTLAHEQLNLLLDIYFIFI